MPAKVFPRCQFGGQPAQPRIQITRGEVLDVHLEVLREAPESQGQILDVAWAETVVLLGDDELFDDLRDGAPKLGPDRVEEEELNDLIEYRIVAKAAHHSGVFASGDMDRRRVTEPAFRLAKRGDLHRGNRRRLDLAGGELFHLLVGELLGLFLV